MTTGVKACRWFPYNYNDRCFQCRSHLSCFDHRLDLGFPCQHLSTAHTQHAQGEEEKKELEDTIKAGAWWMLYLGNPEVHNFRRQTKIAWFLPPF